jgi:t-SNARE complex subunit (syntaxin)
MEDFCECENYYDGFKVVIKHFMANYGKFLKMKGKDITSKEKYNNFESLYTTLKQTMQSLPGKGNECISFMKKCKKGHKVEIEDVNSKLEKVDALSQRIEDYHEKLIKEIPEELEEYSDEEEEIQNRNSMYNEDEIEVDDKLYENVDVRQTMLNDQKNIIMIQNLLDNEELKAKKEEEKRELAKLKNQLMDMYNNIEVDLNQQGEQIDDVVEKVDNGFEQVVDGDDELEKAAKLAVKNRRLKYQAGLAITLGAIGTVVPGIGNAIGVALGGIIGYGLYRADKHRLKKALKRKKEMRDKRNKK